eukprot:TRINITY_DN25893_c0_g1_i1.p1 TRINITY_DN25893_c0_g1~~TRINITY_DN25893_c0_g1_i1.p1  ORF type:complete len:535 (+),score=47.82 TRINITY_DN25893_c0_g1_i1:152-1756(+)
MNQRDVVLGRIEEPSGSEPSSAHPLTGMQALQIHVERNPFLGLSVLSDENNSYNIPGRPTTLGMDESRDSWEGRATCAGDSECGSEAGSSLPRNPGQPPKPPVGWSPLGGAQAPSTESGIHASARGLGFGFTTVETHTVQASPSQGSNSIGRHPFGMPPVSTSLFNISNTNTESSRPEDSTYTTRTGAASVASLRSVQSTQSMAQRITERGSAVLGLPQGSHAPPENITQETLVANGMTPQRATATVAQQNQDVLLTQIFARWISCFFTTVCVLLPVMFSVLVWMILMWLEYRTVMCDVPLQMWCEVVTFVVAWNTFTSGSVRTRCLYYVCAYDPEADVSYAGPPLRVRIAEFMLPAFFLAWDCVGLHWVHMSGKIVDDPNQSCKIKAPGLWLAVLVYATCNFAFTTFMFVNMLGFRQFLRIMLRAGVLRSNQAAPKGSLEKRTTVIQSSDSILQEQTSCSICLEDWSENDGEPIVRTNECNHCFHRHCLKGWLNVHRSCPLCRTDLAHNPNPPPASQPRPVPIVPSEPTAAGP